MQSLPVMNIKPLLVLPIKKSQSFTLLMKSVISIYNIFPLMIIPFGIFNIVNYGTLNIIWMLVCIFCIDRQLLIF
jgi:hypothetical protein